MLTKVECISNVDCHAKFQDSVLSNSVVATTSSHGSRVDTIDVRKLRNNTMGVTSSDLASLPSSVKLRQFVRSWTDTSMGTQT
jgi:hypothetical protein